MTVNPYQASSLDELPRSRRPLGIVILALYHLLLGGIWLAINLQALGLLSPMQGYTPSSLVDAAIVVRFLLGVVAVVSAAGMILAKRWGWWLASYVQSHMSAICCSKILSAAMMPVLLEGTGQSPSSYVVRQLPPLGIHLLLYIYLLRANVLDYFDLSELNKRKATLLLIGICSVFMGVIWFRRFAALQT